jgi:hypothetical protein
MHQPILINELLILLQAFAELPARFRQPPHPVKDFLFHYRYVFYISWAVFCIIRTGMNGKIYEMMDNEDVQYSGRARNPEDTVTSIIVFFTFWWLDYKTEEDLELRKRMQKSNVVNVCFIIYTLLIFALWLYNNYDYRGTS